MSLLEFMKLLKADFIACSVSVILSIWEIWRMILEFITLDIFEGLKFFSWSLLVI